jgi:hypothetical protein
MGRPVLQSESAENAQPGPGAAPPSFSPGPDIQKQKQNSLFEEWGDELPVMTATQMRFTQVSDTDSSSPVPTNPTTTATAQLIENIMVR